LSITPLTRNAENRLDVRKEKDRFKKKSRFKKRKEKGRFKSG
jgi:hypothetical protein